MTMDFTTDNIDRLQAIGLDPPRGWQITFRSGNAGMQHQLYVNGQLADYTDTADQRSFLLDQDACPREIVIAAVDAASRTVDLSEHLPPDLQQPAWVYRAAAVRAINHRSGDRMMILGDHASGQLTDQPLAVADIWPGWVCRWAWGEDPFGLGGFGYDGKAAPGLGKGAFGAGLFGIGADLITLTASLAEQGQHQIVLRTTTTGGKTADGPIQLFDAQPPPAPPTSLAVTDYDSQTNTVTLSIE